MLLLVLVGFALSHYVVLWARTHCVGRIENKTELARVLVAGRIGVPDFAVKNDRQCGIRKAALKDANRVAVSEVYRSTRGESHVGRGERVTADLTRSSKANRPFSVTSRESNFSHGGNVKGRRLAEILIHKIVYKFPVIGSSVCSKEPSSYNSWRSDCATGAQIRSLILNKLPLTNLQRFSSFSESVGSDACGGHGCVGSTVRLVPLLERKSTVKKRPTRVKRVITSPTAVSKAMLISARVDFGRPCSFWPYTCTYIP